MRNTFDQTLEALDTGEVRWVEDVADNLEAKWSDITDKTRWGYVQETVWEHPSGRFLLTRQWLGATELQENEPISEAFEVEPYDVTVTKYRRLEQEAK